MKKQTFGMVAALFALMLALFAGAYAADTDAAEPDAPTETDAAETETAELSAANIAYAILYEDGTLVFQNSDTPETGRAVTKTYEVDLNAVYTSSYGKNPTPWDNEIDSIRVVSFADKVLPTSTACWFFCCVNLERVDNILNLDTANITDMQAMFDQCIGLTTLDVSHFDTSNVTNMSLMFYECRKLTALDVSNFDTANVTDMSRMFEGCSRLTALDVSNFDTANVTDMGGMFNDCSELTTLDVSHFDTTNVTDMSFMFADCRNLKTIFYASDKFTTASVKYSSDMFGMFLNCTSLVGGNGTAYDENHTDKEYARIDAPGTPGYFTDKNAPAPVAYAITDAAPNNGKLSVTLTNPGAATLAVSYFDANGKFVSVALQDVSANAGTVALALSADAKAARVVLLDSDCRPLCAAYPATL